MKSLSADRLLSLGWSNFFLGQLELSELGCPPVGRVVFESRGQYTVIGEDGERSAVLSGRYRERCSQRGDWPAVGDWLRLRPPESDGPAVIEGRLDRRSALSRKAADGRRQVVGANIDLVLITTSLGANLNLRRIERYLSIAREGEAEPVVLLTKADQVVDVEGPKREVERVAGGATVIALSALRGDGLAAVEALLSPGRTLVFVGSSGVGKSTLVNRLLGEELLSTGPVREQDEKGRHTTTARHLIPTRGGAMLLDTPGMRELGIGDAVDGVSATFEEVVALAARCRFRDCGHEAEPGCAVREAVGDGSLDADRLASHRKLEREARYEAARQDPRLAAEQRDIWKKRTVAASARDAFRAKNGR